MAEVRLQKIEILGDPKKSDDAEFPVRIVYADTPDLERATTSIVVQIVSAASYNLVLAEVERFALKTARKIIDAEIGRSEQLERHSPR